MNAKRGSRKGQTGPSTPASAGLAVDRQRLDKWLWYARLATTRTGAQRLVAAGRVRINRDKTDNPSRAIQPGDVLTVSLGSGVRVLRVVLCGERRGPPDAARRLYDDLSRPAIHPDSGDSSQDGA